MSKFPSLMITLPSFVAIALQKWKYFGIHWSCDLTCPSAHRSIVKVINNIQEQPVCVRLSVQWLAVNDCIPHLLFYKKTSIFIYITPYLYQYINISLINNSYLYQHFIDFRIIMTENKQENVKIRKCVFENVKFENISHYKMHSKIYYNPKFILSWP